MAVGIWKKGRRNVCSTKYENSSIFTLNKAAHTQLLVVHCEQPASLAVLSHHPTAVSSVQWHISIELLAESEVLLSKKWWQQQLY